MKVGNPYLIRHAYCSSPGSVSIPRDIKYFRKLYEWLYLTVSLVCNCDTFRMAGVNRLQLVISWER